MTSLYRRCGLLLCLMMSSPGIMASESAYLLPKAGLLDFRLDGVRQTWAAALTGGWRISDRLSTELEFLHTLAPARYDSAVYGPGEHGEYGVSALAAYGNWRLPVQEILYLKLRGGLLAEQLDARLPDRRQRYQDLGLSAGAGIGVSLLQRLTLELEATVLERDILFYSLALHYRFY